MDHLIDNLVLLREQYGNEENNYFQAGDLPNYHLSMGKRLAMEAAINEARKIQVILKSL